MKLRIMRNVPRIGGAILAALLLFVSPKRYSVARLVELGSRFLGSQDHLNKTTIELPAPTGPFAIGTKIYNWSDISRHEKASKNPADFRQLVVQVWYPTRDRSKALGPYVPKIDSYRNIWDDSEIDIASRTLTHSQLNATAISKGRFPIVLLSHGWEGTRSEYTSVAEDLASHGFAVFGVDHPYMGRIVLPNGQVTEPTESQFKSPAEIVDYYSQDLEFVIAQLVLLNQADADQLFTGKLDVSKIASIGHSSGFVATSGACKRDPRIKACVNIDAPGFTSADLAGLQQPLLWIRLQKAGKIPADFLKTRKNAVYELKLAGATHGSVEDWDYLEANSPAQRKSAGEILQTLREYLNAFVSKHLSDRDSKLLNADYSSASVQLKVFPRNDVFVGH